MKRACKRMDNHRERMDYHHHRGGGTRRHERGSNWSDPEIVELLSLWSDEAVQLELESSLRNQHVFDRLASALRERGIYRTGDQCREKIKKMKLEYRRIKDNHKLRSWKFYDVMDRVLANRPVLSYSALGGAVLAHQHGLRSPAGGMDVYTNQAHPLGLPLAAAFGPAASGGFLFGHPPRMYDDEEDTLRVKCEDVETSGDDGMLSGDGPAVPPELLYGYGSGGDDDTDGRSAELNEEVPVPFPVRRGGESATNISPSSGCY